MLGLGHKIHREDIIRTGNDGAKWLWSLLLITASIWLLMRNEQRFSGGRQGASVAACQPCTVCP